jgi:adenylate kinase
VASGELLREHRQRGTELGRAAQAYMDRGDLVPDDLVVDMVTQRLSRSDAERGAVLDGFPRTPPQAAALDRRLQVGGDAVSAALYLDVPKRLLVERLAGRWICGTCQTTYHERFSPPQVPGVCDVCGGELTQRPDDRREVVQNRVEVYLRETTPTIEHYAGREVVQRVDGTGSIETVRARLCFALGGAIRGLRRDRVHLFIEHHAPPGPSAGRWLGRTLCGKLVPRNPNGARESVEAFEHKACRECRRELRARRAPPPSTPLVDAPVDVAAEAGAS